MMYTCQLALVYSSLSISSHMLTLLSCIGKSNYSKSWYDNNDSPAKRIRDELRISFLTWTISMPSDPSSCHLTATLNVFGRLLNRIPESEVCTRTANFHTVTGQFVHIEQTDEALLPINYANFAKAVNRAIGTTCKPPMQMHPVTLLCVWGGLFNVHGYYPDNAILDPVPLNCLWMCLGQVCPSTFQSSYRGILLGSVEAFYNPIILTYNLQVLHMHCAIIGNCIDIVIYSNPNTISSDTTPAQLCLHFLTLPRPPCIFPKLNHLQIRSQYCRQMETRMKRTNV